MSAPHERRDGPYDLDPPTAEWLGQVTAAPVAPDAVRERLADARLVTADIPSHLGDRAAGRVDPNVALYRLTQLFGTPNVPGREAGADQPERYRTTWQYLFRVTEAEEAGREWLLSVYDYETELSAGVARFERDEGPRLPEPRAAGRDAALPDEETARRLVVLALQLVTDPVQATYEGRLV